MDRRRGVNALHGPLSRVEIRFDGLAFPPQSWGSPWGGKWVGTDDPAFLARVENWLAGLEQHQQMALPALRQFCHKIVLTFRDGRQEELFCYGAIHPGDSSGTCGGIKWQKFFVVGGQEPFTDFIRSLRAP